MLLCVCVHLASSLSPALGFSLSASVLFDEKLRRRVLRWKKKSSLAFLCPLPQFSFLVIYLRSLLSCSRSFIHSVSTARQLSSNFRIFFILFLSCYKSQLRLNFFKCNARYVFEALFNTEINILILESLNLKDQRLFV